MQQYGWNNAVGNFAQVNHINLYYEIYGRGEPILLLHGNGQSIAAFAEQIPYFEMKYKVVVPDCRGRGRSGNTSDELTYEIQARDMSELMDHLGLSSAHIMGWSDGGIIGLLMAMHYPSKVKSLITSGVNVLQDETVFSAAEISFMKNMANDMSQPLITRRRYNLMLKYPNISFESLGAIDCPVMVVAGDRDEIKIGHTIRIFESIKKAQLFIVPNASHLLLYEVPQIFNEAAFRFLRGQKRK